MVYLARFVWKGINLCILVAAPLAGGCSQDRSRAAADAVIPRLLARNEYLETARDPMIEISGREDALTNEGVIDIEPYIASIPQGDFQGLTLLPGKPPSAVYRAGNNRFDHVLYPMSRANAFLVIVVQLRPDHVLGHYLLDLNKEYDLDAPRHEEL